MITHIETIRDSHRFLIHDHLVTVKIRQDGTVYYVSGGPHYLPTSTIQHLLYPLLITYTRLSFGG